MLYVLTLGVVFCGWALLGVLGGERERRLRELEDEQAAAADETNPPPPAH